MRRRVSPPFRTAGLGWLSILVGPVVASECRGHVSRRPVAYDARCCAKPFASRRGHVTALFFEWDAPRVLGAGVGPERAVLGRVAGLRGVVPRMGGVCIGYKAACSPMWGHVVGIWVEERVGLVLGSS